MERMEGMRGRRLSVLVVSMVSYGSSSARGAVDLGDSVVGGPRSAPNKPVGKLTPALTAVAFTLCGVPGAQASTTRLSILELLMMVPPFVGAESAWPAQSVLLRLSV